ncbi:MAG TPA: DUF983 domain-containing protein [Bacteroidia bacterium]|nr:DUF983 domain-containing protein [Bacteroidia bacterium]
MKPACPHCGYAFEKETGFFWGAMYVSYGLTIVEIAAILLVSQPFFTEKLDDRMIWIVAAGILLLSAFNYRKSRAIWLYLFTPRKVKEQKV